MTTGDRSLVPLEAVDSRSTLSERQRETMVRQGMRYLQANGIPINTSSLKAAGLVINDAFSRGLAILEQNAVGPRESLVNIVNAGLDMREQLRKQSGEVVGDRLNHPQLSEDFLGSLALPTPLVDEVKKELARFKLLDRISACEQLVKLREERLAILDNFVSFALNFLPDEDRDRARRRLESSGDKSKLIRNMIVHVIFGNVPRLIIPTDELVDLNNSYHRNPERFDQDFERLVSVLDRFGLSLDESSLDFLRGLYGQVVGLFTRSKTASKAHTDRVFFHFQRGLLLLNPVLEDVPIRISPDKIGGDEPTIWDEGYAVEILGHEIPKRETLIGATKQAEAAGYYATAETLKQGIRAWAAYERERTGYPGKFRSASRQVERQRTIVENLRRSWTDVVLPRSSFDLRRLIAIQRKEAGEINFALHTAESIFEHSRLRRNMVLALYRKAQKTPLGENVEVPLEIYLEGLASQMGVVARERTKLEKELKSREESIINSAPKYEREKFFGLFSGVLLKGDGGDIKRLEALDSSLSSNPQEHIFSVMELEKSFSLGFVERELDTFVSWKAYRLSLGLNHLDRKTLLGLRKTSRSDPYNENVLNLVSRIVLRKVIRDRKEIADVRSKIMELDERELSLTAKRAMYLNDPSLSLPEDAKKSHEWIRDLWRRTQISSLPRDFDKPYMNQAAAKLLNVYPSVLLEVLPQDVDQKKFRQALVNETVTLETDLAEKKTALDDFIKQFPGDESKKYLNLLRSYNRTEMVLKTVEVFLGLLDHPILEIKTAEGMRTNVYLGLISRRAALIRRIQEIPRRKDETRIASNSIVDLRREQDYREALDELARLEAGLKELQGSKVPEARLVAAMKRLGLAVQA